MLIKILCPECNQEKELEVKVPKFCSNECKKSSFKKMVQARRKVQEVPSPTINPPDAETPPTPAAV